MKNLSKCQKNDDYTQGNLLNYLYKQKHSKFIGIDLSRETNTSVSQHINFIRKLEDDNRATMSFIARKQQKVILNFSVAFL